MRGSNNNALDTINAAATAIASAENRVRQVSVQKRRWGSCLSMYWCFGSQNKHGKRIVVPELTAPGTVAPAAENPTQAPAIVLPFVAPPSSPASFLQSEPPSCTQSPVGLLSFTSISASMYSPGPASIFAIGPYAHETQLVSPPAFTTEPSTASFTPPPESVQLTTPSSPEIPFARHLDPTHQNEEAGQRFPLSQYEFISYQLYPGSPVGHLISPSSGISGSGTSSPFPDREFTPGGPQFLQIRIDDPPKLLSLDRLSAREWGSQQGSGSLTPDAVRRQGSGSLTPDAVRWQGSGSLTPAAVRRQGSGSLTPDAVRPRSQDSFLLVRQNSDIAPLSNSFNRGRNDEVSVDHRVSFEITAEDVVQCMAKEPNLAKAMSPTLAIPEIPSLKDEDSTEAAKPETSDDAEERASVDGEERQRLQKHRSITLGSSKEFNFDNADGGNDDKPTIGSDWWANEKVIGKENGHCKNWSFFPMMQPGVS